MPKYKSEKVMNFDTLKGQLIIDKAFSHESIQSRTLVPFTNEEVGYNTFQGLRNDISYSFPFLLFNSISWSYYENSKNFKTVAKAIERMIKKNNIFLLFDVEAKKVIRTFGKYPDIYHDNFNNIANFNHYFVTDEKTNFTYSSFQADENITVYDINGNIVNLINAPGKMVKKEKLSLSIFNREVVKRRNLYNSFCDSYENVYLFDNQLFRVYNVALPGDSLMIWLPETSSPRCIPYSTEIDWINFTLLKPRYLQQLSLDGKEIKEFPFPDGVNTFIGYDKEKEVYYFRKLKLGKGNFPQGNATIYAFKVE
ncbi:MAG: hypothetical protein ABIR66_02635 [Saprospiraceae bacterium]